MIEIFVSKFNNPELEKNCVEAILKHTTEPYHLTVYHNEKNENQLKYSNYFVNKSKADYFIGLGSDTIVTEGWLDKIREAIEKESNWGFMSVMTDCGHPSQQKEVLNYYQVDEMERLSGFCSIYPVEIYKKLGGLDENFQFWCSDMDYCWRVKKAGLRVLLLRNVFIKHLGSQSIRKEERETGRDYNKMHLEDQEYFKNKWGLKGFWGVKYEDARNTANN